MANPFIFGLFLAICKGYFTSVFWAHLGQFSPILQSLEKKTATSHLKQIHNWLEDEIKAVLLGIEFLAVVFRAFWCFG